MSHKQGEDYFKISLLGHVRIFPSALSSTLAGAIDVMMSTQTFLIFFADFWISPCCNSLLSLLHPTPAIFPGFLLNENPVSPTLLSLLSTFSSAQEKPKSCTHCTTFPVGSTQGNAVLLWNQNNPKQTWYFFFRTRPHNSPEIPQDCPLHFGRIEDFAHKKISVWGKKREPPTCLCPRMRGCKIHVPSFHIILLIPSEGVAKALFSVVYRWLQH